MKLAAILVLLGMSSPLLAAAIADGSAVELEYTLMLAETGETIQTNVGDAPLSYVHGQGLLLPALEQELMGHEANDEFEVQLAAAQAYGVVDPALYREVEAEQIPEGAREVGAMLSAPGYQGAIRVREVRDDMIVLDFNHPLAGEDLRFKIRVVSVADRPPEPPAVAQPETP